MNNDAIMFVKYVPYKPKDTRNWWQKLLNQPLPLTPLGATPARAGLNEYTAYRVFDVNSYSDEAEAYFCVMNQRGELWWLSNRYFAVHCLVERNEIGKFVGLSVDSINASIKLAN